mgnify:CR=1 FL=1
MYSRFTSVGALVVAGVLLSSCGGPTDPSDNVTETFTGTVAVGGSGVHTFSVSNDGELFVTLITLTPPLPAAKFASLWLGTSSSGSCVWDGPRNNTAIPGTGVTNSVREGTVCVGIFDQGGANGFTVDETYEIRVSHP